MTIDRLPDESDLAYHKRLVYGKLEDKTLADYDYSELAERIYGKEYASDVARRMMYGSRKTLDLLAQEDAGRLDPNTENILNVRLLELQKERQRFFDQRREYNKLVAKGSREDHLVEMLADAANKLGDEIGILVSDPQYETADPETEAVLVFSDWHYGMKTQNIFNEFNTEICKERVRTIVRRAYYRILLHQCSALHVVILGDLYHGAIHTSARVASEELVCDQLMHASEILAQAIYDVSRCVPHTFVYMTYGNHARTVPEKKDSIYSDNMEKVVHWWLQERFRHDQDITVMPIPDYEFATLEVCGHTMCATHGDLDDVHKSPRLLTTLFQKRMGVDLEYILLGDKHHRESFNELGVTSLICGSLCGTDDYANNKRLYSDPSQTLLIVNRTYGVDAEYQLYCRSLSA